MKKCDWCGKILFFVKERHHFDYDEDDQIIYLCNKCHKEYVNKEEEKQAKILQNDTLIINFAKKYWKFCTILVIDRLNFIKLNPKNFISSQFSGTLYLSVSEYKDLIESIQCEYLYQIINRLESIDWDTLNNPHLHNYISQNEINFIEEITDFYNSGIITDFLKLAEIIDNRIDWAYGDIFREVLVHLAHKHIENEFKLKTKDYKSKNEFYKYIVNSEININNPIKSWEGICLIIYMKYLQENKVIENIDVVDFIEELKDWIRECELKIFERNLKEEDTSDSFSVIDIDFMTGLEFEKFVGDLFRKMGYVVELTNYSHDQGGDILVKKDDELIVVQAKRYSGGVGNKAVQEVIAAQKFYNASAGIVVTNSSFTKSAIELAKKSNVRLINRDRLIKFINMYFDSKQVYPDT